MYILFLLLGKSLMSITVYIDYGIEIVTESLDFYYADMSEVLV